VPADSIELVRENGRHVADVAKLEDGTLVIGELAACPSNSEGEQLDVALRGEGPGP